MNAQEVHGPRILKDYELIYFMNPERTTYLMGDKTWTMQVPFVAIHPPGVTQGYSIDGGSPVRHQFVHFMPGPILEEFLNRYPDKRLFTLEHSKLFVDMYSELLNICAAKPFQWQERFSALLFSMITHLLSGEAESETAKLPTNIMQAVQYMHRCAAQDINMKQIAESTGWSQEHFSRVFRSYVGSSPITYLMRLRVELACRSLTHTKDSIRQIAEHSGFKSEYYFSRVFRQFKSVTPSDYRKRSGKYIDSSEQEQESIWRRQHPINTYFKQE
ncbi:AraC family transcriptional regulator [Paenibacillus roseipurpureus]|uniref:AraC family transcriptional regulator n=1 Tax=Paenibacillus roseopurpureus TaxID=2918901 RepID=A0AA96RJ41_9BACL|nr:AraC family transcriptional regulator [Paenibacillus sp. MBLB1832]WNR43475.1 AraC family transcriptional regulator [Paenibacillus sp. MBLB1832]